MLKRFAFLAVILAVCLGSVACSDERRFTHAELVLPLDGGYEEIESADFDKAYTNGAYVVTVLRISYVAAMTDGIAETLSAPEFAELWLERCDRSANVIKNPITHCEYYDSDGVGEHFYFEAFYRSKYAYFVILFAADSDAEDAAREEFMRYAENLYFEY